MTGPKNQPHDSLPQDVGSDDASSSDLNYSQNEFGETISFVNSGDTSKKTAERDIETDVPSTIGRYEVRGLLGRGAFGAVYVGYDGQLARQVAIKVPLLEASESIRESFLREAQQLAQLRHSNIVVVYDVGVEDDACFVVSAYLEGQNLNQWIRERKPDWRQSADIVATLADALAAAHAAGVVHRDVKPSNVIVCDGPDGPTPFLVDFGLALSEISQSSVEGRRGTIAGTPNYMSPEQARGEGHRIDGRTDVYSLGVVLYRMLSGELPFKAASIEELLEQVIEDEPRPPRQFVRDIPRELERICLKAMAKQIADRYTTAGDLVEELRTFLKREEAEREAVSSVRTGEQRPTEAMRILIADDHQLSRFKLETDLKKWGHQVVAAEDGEQAWRQFQTEEFAIVITDWMMPNVDGLELVRRIRESDRADYVYVIMLTSKAEKQDVVMGMGAGADDFLGKPFHRDELQVRLRAGARITRLNRQLNETNRRIKRSLDAAAQIQRLFLPTVQPQIPGIDVSWQHSPCDKLGGDMLNVVPLDDTRVGLYVLDVSGEGVPAALLASTLSRVMSPAADPASILVERTGGVPGFRILQPAEAVSAINRKYGGECDEHSYFTLAYGVIDLASHEFRFSTAGHPAALHMRSDGSVAMLDVDGFPIGMAPEDQQFEERSVGLHSGERLLLYSDGLTDAMSEHGEVFGAARLLDAVRDLRGASLADMTKALVDDVGRWRGGADFSDDVSLLAAELQ